MKDAPELFADLRALFEDLHGLAVEGQDRDLPGCAHTTIASSIRSGLTGAHRTLLEIVLVLP